MRTPAGVPARGRASSRAAGTAAAAPRRAAPRPPRRATRGATGARRRGRLRAEERLRGGDAPLEVGEHPLGDRQEALEERRRRRVLAVDRGQVPRRVREPRVPQPQRAERGRARAVAGDAQPHLQVAPFACWKSSPTCPRCPRRRRPTAPRARRGGAAAARRPRARASSSRVRAARLCTATAAPAAGARRARAGATRSRARGRRRRRPVRRDDLAVRLRRPAAAPGAARGARTRRTRAGPVAGEALARIRPHGQVLDARREGEAAVRVVEVEAEGLVAVLGHRVEPAAAAGAAPSRSARKATSCATRAGLSAARGRGRVAAHAVGRAPRRAFAPPPEHPRRRRAAVLPVGHHDHPVGVDRLHRDRVERLADGDRVAVDDRAQRQRLGPVGPPHAARNLPAPSPSDGGGRLAQRDAEKRSSRQSRRRARARTQSPPPGIAARSQDRRARRAVAADRGPEEPARGPARGQVEHQQPRAARGAVGGSSVAPTTRRWSCVTATPSSETGGRDGAGAPGAKPLGGPAGARAGARSPW